MKSISKKISIICLSVLLLNVKLFAMGAGVQAAVLPNLHGVEGDLKGTVRLMELPVVYGFGIEAGAYENEFTFGFSGFGDFWILDKQLNNTLNIYAGPGLAAHVITNQDFNWTGMFGVRAIVGINYLMYDNYLEFYAQTGAEPCLVVPFTENPELDFNINFPCEIGFRVHF